jgi:hypothetical protein
MPEPFLRITPAHDLKDAALTTFQGARYHLDAVQAALTTPGVQTLWRDDPTLTDAERSALTRQLNALHCHIRGFFWELASVFDAILFWANQRFELGLPERDVLWSNVAKEKATIDGPTWARTKAVLKTTWESDWFFEVREYRNFAHRSFLLLTAQSKREVWC